MTQNYANHVHRPTTWLVAVAGGLVVTGMLIWDATLRPSLQAVALVGIGLVVLLAVTLMRAYAVRLQDRVIRLEMVVRLTRLGRAPSARALSVKQLVALRFASDAELPALIDRAATEKLTPDQIKRAVTEWQADDLRT